MANELKENVAAEAGGESAAEGMGADTEEEHTVSTEDLVKEASTKTITSHVSGPQPSVSTPYSDVQPPADEEAEAGMSDILRPESFTISGFRDFGKTFYLSYPATLKDLFVRSLVYLPIFNPILNIRHFLIDFFVCS